MKVTPYKYLLRQETPGERAGLPVPTELEKHQAWFLLPNTPLDQKTAERYGALMFALGRRQVTMEISAWAKENNLQEET